MATEIFKVKNFLVAVTPHSAELVDARVIVNAGASKEETDQWGTAHFLEHMFFKGTKRHTYGELNRLAAKLGDVNAHTSHHATAYLLQMLPGDLNEGARLLMELAFEPAFPEDEFEKEMGVIVEECQTGLDQPMHYFFDQMTWHLLGDQYGHPVIGTMDSIKATTPDKLRRFVADHYNPANMLISFVGPVTPDQVKAVLEQCLPDLPDGQREPWWKDTLALDEFNFHHQSKQAIIALITEGITLQAEMDHNYMPDVFCNALGGGMHSLLFDRLREKLGLCYHVGAHHSSSATSGEMLIYCLLDENNIALAVEECGKIVADVKAHGFDSEMLEIAKRNYLFGFAKRRLTPSGIAGMVEGYFYLDPKSLNHYISFEDRAKRVNGLTNKNVIDFANFVFSDAKPQGVVTMTHASTEAPAEPCVVDDRDEDGGPATVVDKTREPVTIECD
jgi:predicted Zn-dependent peptidase